MAPFDVSKRNNIGFRFSSTQRERVKLAVDQGARLESSPTAIHEGTTFEKIMNLRPRQCEKEIGPPSFRYRPNNYLEKLKDGVLNQNPPNWGKIDEVFAPSLLNKKGEVAKNLKPLDYKAEGALRTRLAKKMSQASHEASVESCGTGSREDTISIEDVETRSKVPQKNLKDLKAPRTSVSKIVRPKYLLPSLHAKTHFKAAIEYSLGPELTHRSLHDKNRKMETAIFEEYQKTVKDGNRKVGSAMTYGVSSTIPHGEYGRGSPKQQYSERYYTSRLTGRRATEQPSLSNRLNIRKNQEKIAEQSRQEEFGRLFGGRVAGAAKTPAPVQALNLAGVTNPPEMATFLNHDTTRTQM